MKVVINRITIIKIENGFSIEYEYFDPTSQTYSHRTEDVTDTKSMISAIGAECARFDDPKGEK